MVSPYSRFLSESGKKREENFIHEGGYISLYLHPLARPWVKESVLEFLQW